MHLTFQEGLTYLEEARSPVLSSGTVGLAIAASGPTVDGETCAFHVACTFLLPIAVHDAFHRVSQGINLFLEDPCTGQGAAISFLDPRRALAGRRAHHRSAGAGRRASCVEAG